MFIQEILLLNFATDLRSFFFLKDQRSINCYKAFENFVALGKYTIIQNRVSKFDS